MNEFTKLNLQYKPQIVWADAFAIVFVTIGLLGTIWCVVNNITVGAVVCAALVARAAIGNPIRTQLTPESQERLLQYVLQSGEMDKESE